MYDYIKGELTELTPTEVVLENNQIGYKILISLQTYSKLKMAESTKLFIYHHLREDNEQLYGFYDKDERSLFTNLIEVSGIGPNSARMMLSSLSSDEIRGAIISGDVNKLKSIKGIGLKTAQRLLIELKDKMVKRGSGDDFSGSFILPQASRQRDEAASALVLLGFSKANVEKVLDTLLKENPSYSLEELIKLSLKRL
ncbi:MAG: Holliday junction DNA helicase RuvA [Bacteroidetes bacterium GWE2_39_28]|nr:MAG: Holliday junction DNA helicase RuvA [Bacteroidetes bacterium GWE2_39_28]OFY12318.1 MAG: Holliday junction DNA helicase RuvA [Bacteroidetes bacterium GWF2_39_10]OFZ07069.1 MAG: Holliday junction DNA helicase RuvA [Bacteroidetes bacterium RIFOXYB2_FULL_39_7]OFZ11967.1 MAG: Holliday junction DNA helicase RuvA [Bacteroidetes bacterium RIFOXYC2_FULL_39_11]HCT95050.1 Holliday junction branch migration protein RuvA [Rikenellaceae bacterium]